MSGAHEPYRSEQSLIRGKADKEKGKEPDSWTLPKVNLANGGVFVQDSNWMFRDVWYIPYSNWRRG